MPSHYESSKLPRQHEPKRKCRRSFFVEPSEGSDSSARDPSLGHDSPQGPPGDRVIALYNVNFANQTSSPRRFERRQCQRETGQGVELPCASETPSPVPQESSRHQDVPPCLNNAFRKDAKDQLENRDGALGFNLVPLSLGDESNIRIQGVLRPVPPVSCICCSILATAACHVSGSVCQTATGTIQVPRH